MFHALTNRVKSLLGLLYSPMSSTHTTNTTFLPSTPATILGTTISPTPNSLPLPSSAPPATGLTTITTWTNLLTTTLNHYLPHTPHILQAAAKRTLRLHARTSASAKTITDVKRRNPIIGALDGPYVYSFREAGVDGSNHHRRHRDVDHLDPRIHDDADFGKGCDEDDYNDGYNQQQQKKTWMADIDDRTMLFIAPPPSDASTTTSSTDREEMGAWSDVQEEEFDEFEEFERNVLGVVRDERGGDKMEGWTQWLPRWVPVFGRGKIPGEETEEEDGKKEEDITGYLGGLERRQHEDWEWVIGCEERLLPRETDNDPENEWEFMPIPTQIPNNGLSAFANNIIPGPRAPRMIGTFTEWAESWDWRKEGETLVEEESWKVDSDLENLDLMEFDDDDDNDDDSLDGEVTDAMSLSLFLGYEKVEYNNIGRVRRLRDLISLPDPDDLPFALPSKDTDRQDMYSELDTMDETLVDSVELTFPFALSTTSPTSTTLTSPPSTAGSEISLLPDREIGAENLPITSPPRILQELATLDTSFHLPPLQTPQTPVSTEPTSFYALLSPPTTPQRATSPFRTFEPIAIPNPPPSPASSSSSSSCLDEDFDTFSDLLTPPYLGATIPLTPPRQMTSDLPLTPVSGSRTHICACPSPADCAEAEETEYDDDGVWREARAMIRGGSGGGKTKVGGEGEEDGGGEVLGKVRVKR